MERESDKLLLIFNFRYIRWKLEPVYGY